MTKIHKEKIYGPLRGYVVLILLEFIAAVRAALKRVALVR